MADVVTALMTNLPITAAVGLAITAAVDLVVVVAVVDLGVIAAAISLAIAAAIGMEGDCGSDKPADYSSNRHGDCCGGFCFKSNSSYESCKDVSKRKGLKH